MYYGLHAAEMWILRGPSHISVWIAFYLNSQICDLFPHYSSDHAGMLFLFLIKEQI